MKIEVVRNYVVFTFVEEIRGERFVNSTTSGLILTSDDKSQTTYPRWGKAVAIGPDVDGVSVDDYILIEPGKWTSRFHVGDKELWKTEDTFIIATSDEPGHTY
jgi:hypothetical protein